MIVVNNKIVLTVCNYPINHNFLIRRELFWLWWWHGWSLAPHCCSAIAGSVTAINWCLMAALPIDQ